MEELVIPVTGPAPRDTFSSGYDPLSNYDYGSYDGGGSLGQPSDLPLDWTNDSFIAPPLPEVIVETIKPKPSPLPLPEIPLAAASSTSLATAMGGLLMLAFPTPIGAEPDVTTMPKYNFEPEAPLPEVVIEAQRGINKPPPITPDMMDTGFPNLPPNWWDLANEPTNTVFSAPERAKDWLDYLLEKIPGAARFADLVDLTLRVTDTGKSDAPGRTTVPDSLGLGSESLPTRTSRVDPTGTVVYGYTAPFGYTLDDGTDLSPFNVDSLAQPSATGVPDRSATPEPAPIPSPTRRPAPDPFVTPRVDPFTPFGDPTVVVPGDPIAPKFATPVPTVTPLDPLLTPFNPVIPDIALAPEPAPEPQADHCNCANTKTKPKKRKKRKPRDKCFEYTNHQYKDGTVRVETKEVPCETKKGRPRKTRSDKGKKRAGPKYGKPGQFPTSIGVF